MLTNEKNNTLTKVKRRGSWQVSRETSNDETVNHFTMIVLGVAALSAGFWALACLANAFFHDGPLSMLRQLAAAITGH